MVGLAGTVGVAKEGVRTSPVEMQTATSGRCRHRTRSWPGWPACPSSPEPIPPSPCFLPFTVVPFIVHQVSFHTRITCSFFPLSDIFLVVARYLPPGPPTVPGRHSLMASSLPMFAEAFPWKTSLSESTPPTVLSRSASKSLYVVVVMGTRQPNSATTLATA